MMQSQQKRKSAQDEIRYTFFALLVLAIIMVGGAFVLIVMLQAGFIPTRSSVPTVKLSQGSYSNSVDCAGVIEPIGVHDVYAPVAGKVVSVAVHEGDIVVQGASLFVVQSPMANSSSGQSEAGSGSTSSETQTLGRVEVTAETSGTVTNLRVAAGDVVSDPEKLPVMQIADMNVLVASIQLPEDVLPYVKRGMEVDVTAPSRPGYVLKGTITDIANSTDADTENRAYRRATVMFGDTDDLKVGDKITARIDIDDYGKVYYAPPAAVLEKDGCAYVDIVFAGKTIERHQVRLLGTSDDGQKIIAGDALAEGTTVRADLNT